MDWFLYDNGLRHERVKIFSKSLFTLLADILMSLTTENIDVPSAKS